MSKKLILLAVLVVLAVVVVPAVFAQTVPPAPAPTVRNCTALSPEEALRAVLNLGGSPNGARLLAVYRCTGFATNAVGDTEDLFGADCASNIAIYKVENTGRQGWWNLPGRVCSGDNLSLVTEGTGDYILYSTNNPAPNELTRIVVGGA